MTLKKTEAAVLLATVVFVCLSLGYFWGQRSAIGEITVRTSAGEAQPTAGESPPEESAVQAAGIVNEDDLVPQEQPSPQETGTEQPQSQESPKPSPSEAEPGGTGTVGGLININTADAELLEQLPGIGEVLAQRIVDYRDEIGRFGSIEQILDVKGIGEATMEKIRAYITVG